MALEKHASSSWGSGFVSSSMSISQSYSPRDPGEEYYYDYDNIAKVLIPISVFGWIAFGAICILCINGHGRAGRWIPEWYLDSKGTRWDKTAVAAWWLAVIVGWPLILPGVVVGHLSRKLKRARVEKRLKTEREGEGEGEAKASWV